MPIGTKENNFIMLAVIAFTQLDARYFGCGTVFVIWLHLQHNSRPGQAGQFGVNVIATQVELFNAGARRCLNEIGPNE